MKNRYTKKISMLVMATSLVATIGMNSNHVYATTNEDVIIKNAMQSIKKQGLTQKLDTLKDKPIDTLIDVTSDKEIGVIVQLKADVTKETKEKIKSSQNKFKEFITTKNKKSKSKINIKEEYTTVFNGVSLRIKSSEVESLLKSSEVERVWLDQTVTIDPIKEDVIKSKSNKKNPSNVDSVIQIEADKLQKNNITGKGVKVGVLDTGLDYNHPDLKRNYKGGYDCIDEDTNPMESTYDDWVKSGKPQFLGTSSYYTSHGTHVAGSIAGNGRSDLKHSVKGVAPGANLYAYRVLGPYGTGFFSDIIQGIELAVTQGMDVINLSLGSNENNPYSPVAQAVNMAMLKGTTVVVAAGNNYNDVGSLGTPAAASFPITVGASSANITKTTYDFTVNNQNYTVKSLASDLNGGIDKLENNTYSVVYADAGDEYSYKNLKLTKENVEGKIVLIAHGWGALTAKLELADKYGAAGVIVYNRGYGEISGIFEGKNLATTFSISKALGEQLLSATKKETVNITFGNKTMIKDGNEELAYFSSTGPSYYEFDVKPDVVAPGVDVFSTVPVYKGDLETLNYDYAYGRMSGTSMAAPHVAGAAALLKQANKKLTPFDIKKALMNTAEKLDSEYAVNEIGAGRINVYNAANTSTVISSEDITKIEMGQTLVDVKGSTGSLAFGKYSDDKTVKVEKELVISNNFNKEKKFDVNVEFYNNAPALNAQENNVKLKNVPNRLVIAKKSSVILKPTIVVPATAEKGSYQGYIQLTNKENASEKHQIPFSINYSKEGIKDVVHLMEGTSTKYAELFDPLLEATLTLGSHMNEISVFLQDANTKEILGISGSANISAVPIGTPLRLGVFAGYVLPIDKQGNVGKEFIRLSEGDYNVIYYTKDALGREYIDSEYTWIDNTSPQLTFEQQPGIYELDEIPEVFEITGKAFDEGMDHVIKRKGEATDLTQGWNYVYNFEHSSYANFDVTFPDKKGNFTLSLYPNMDNNVSKFGVSAIDKFGAGSWRERNDYFIVKTGTPYLSTKFDKGVVKQNEAFSMSVEMKNISNFGSGTFAINYLDNHQLEEVELTQEFKEYAASAGYEFELNVENSDEEFSIYNTQTVTLHAVKQGPTALSLDKTINIFDVKLKAVGDFYYASGDYEVYEECYVHNATLNGDAFENILNTNFTYYIFK